MKLVLLLYRSQENDHTERVISFHASRLEINNKSKRDSKCNAKSLLIMVCFKQTSSEASGCGIAWHLVLKKIILRLVPPHFGFLSQFSLLTAKLS